MKFELSITKLRKHLTWDKLSLKEASANDFHRSQWPGIPEAVYVGYRVIVAVYFFIWLLLSVYLGGGIIGHKQDGWVWCIFLTNWSFTVFNLYLVIAAVNVTFNYVRHRLNPALLAQTRTLPVFCKLHWIVYNMQAGLNVLVCCGFWTLLAPFQKDGGVNIVSLHCHLINGLVTIADIFIVAIPINLLHISQTYTVASVYIAFSIVFWSAGGKPFPIYGFLDYEGRPGFVAGVIVGFTFVVIPLMWLAVYGLTKMRARLRRRLIISPSQSDDMDMIYRDNGQPEA